MTVIVISNGGGGGGGADLSGDDITPSSVLDGIKFHNNRGEQKEGEIPNWNGTLKNGSSPAGVGEKFTIQQENAVKYIPAGQYLNKDIEVPAKPQGSATMERNGATITLTKHAGYIEEETPPPIVIPDAEFNSPQRNSVAGGVQLTVKTKTAGYMAENRTIGGTVPLEDNKPITISSNCTNQIIKATDGHGYEGMKKVTLTVNVNPPQSQVNLQGNKTIQVTSNGVQSFGPDSGYNGFEQVTLNVQVTAASTIDFGGATNQNLTGKQVTISANSGTKLKMVGIMGSNKANDNILSLVAINKYNYCYYCLGGGSRGNNGTVTWNDNTVTFDLPYAFSGPYLIWYAYSA